jgi:hypothetical protein
MFVFLHNFYEIAHTIRISQKSNSFSFIPNGSIIFSYRNHIIRNSYLFPLFQTGPIRIVSTVQSMKSIEIDYLYLSNVFAARHSLKVSLPRGCGCNYERTTILQYINLFTTFCSKMTDTLALK